MILFFGRKVNRTSICFILLFAARAFLFCVGVVCIKDFVLQIFCVLLSSLAFLGAVLHDNNHLWVEKSVKVLHILNEVTILVAAVCQLVFSAYVSDMDARSKVGLALIWFITTTISINFLYILYSAFFVMKHLVIRCINFKKYNAHRQKSEMKI